MNKHKCAVTGAFGYSGKYITQKLIDQGHEVITLTNSQNRTNPFGNRVTVFSFNFNNPAKLAESLQGVTLLFNTYWIRFNHKLFTQADAVRNTIILFNAAKIAGVKRIVHISIANSSKDSPLEYFRHKAHLEKALQESGMSYSILRPTVLFGKEDILINNIAWALRHLPVFGIFGNGQYKLQPIYVDDLAELAVIQTNQSENNVINAIGPETFTYRQLIKTIADNIGVKRLIISVPPSIGYLVGKILGTLMNDVFTTRDEIKGLMSNLLYVDTPSTGTTKLTDWMKKNASTLGREYASELARRINRK
jgi:uncharacterized protein YbjT (DUF2867 family)